ncbi:voltage-dependent calcium channel gamma-7 subunit-like [Antedon mediterranea]|uniref:voltage-dependent calcium channel gamma-7 subunit-like n=1 Tax=Antedon mediterranea TaxID=105859 RepID=UPI003AF8F406
MQKLPGLRLGSKKQPLLTVGMLLFGVLSMLLLIGGLFSDYWIVTTELAYEREFGNATLQAWVKLHAGLFKACPYEVEIIWIPSNLWKGPDRDSETIPPYFAPNGKNDTTAIDECGKIPYMSTNLSQPPPNINVALLRGIWKTTILLFISLFLTILGCGMATYGLTDSFSTARRHWVFIAGKTFILSGLFIMLGLLLFFFCIDQVMMEKMPRSNKKVFTYGFSVSFAVISCALPAGEISGVSAVYLYTNSTVSSHQSTRSRPPRPIRSLTAHSMLTPRPSIEPPMLTITEINRFSE